MNPLQFAEIVKMICANARERGAEIMYMDKHDDGSMVLMPLDVVYEKFVKDHKGGEVGNDR